MWETERADDWDGICWESPTTPFLSVFSFPFSFALSPSPFLILVSFTSSSFHPSVLPFVHFSLSLSFCLLLYFISFFFLSFILGISVFSNHFDSQLIFLFSRLFFHVFLSIWIWSFHFPSLSIRSSLLFDHRTTMREHRRGAGTDNGRGGGCFELEGGAGGWSLMNQCGNSVLIWSWL